MIEQLRQEFTQNADRLGVHHFKQVKRDGNVVIYQRNKSDGSLFGYEVFIVNSESFPLPNGQRTATKETYPSAKSFGKTAQTSDFRSYGRNRRIDALWLDLRRILIEIVWSFLMVKRV